MACPASGSRDSPSFSLLRKKLMLILSPNPFTCRSRRGDREPRSATAGAQRHPRGAQRRRAHPRRGHARASGGQRSVRHGAGVRGRRRRRRPVHRFQSVRTSGGGRGGGRIPVHYHRPFSWRPGQVGDLEGGASTCTPPPPPPRPRAGSTAAAAPASA